MNFKSLKLLLAAAVLSIASSPTVYAAGGGVELLDANVNLDNKLSLARGAKFYANYCMGCHSLKYSRYNRVAADLGLDEETIKSLIFTRDEDNEINKPGALMTNSIPVKDSARWFGTSPPDLTVVARARGGGDWIYSYLKGFYRDESRPLGVNNTVFANVGMPHVLADLQGMQELEEHDDGHGHITKTLKLVEPGKMSPGEYDQLARDLTGFLVYVAEPAQLHRTFYGILTLLFLFVFFVIAYFLKKEFWKDIH